jgi:hypothetical protein
MKLKARELKKPELRAPAVLADLYYDLRDRHLLPLVALVLVATAAVPFLLGSDREERLELPAGGGPSAGVAAIGVKGASLTVVAAEPGLRDYRKRLDGRSPSDPFKQQYTGLPKSAQLQSTSTTSSGGGSSSTTESSTATVEVESGGSGGGGSGGGGSAGGSGSGGGSGGSGGGTNPPSSGVRLYEFVFDVQISHTEPTADGGRKMSEPQVRHHVKTLTQLPGEKTPVVTMGGVNLRNGKVYFLVSDEVRSLDGEFNCLVRARGGLCELLEIEPGFPLEPTYGPDKVAYRIKVTKIDTVPAGRLGGKRRRVPRARFSGAALGSVTRP